MLDIMSRELDQIVTQYRESLKKMSALWAHMTQLGQCDVIMARGADEMVERLESAVATLMEKEVMVEKERQGLLELKSVLDISRQTVEAKSKHLGQEEKQKEEAQSLRFKEFQKIHMLQDEKAALENELAPAKRNLIQAMELLDEKNEKLRNLENFHEALVDHCTQDMISLKDETDEARAARSRWDMVDLDISNEVKDLPIDTDKLKHLDQDVYDLKEALKNYKLWYEEELQTKLFYSTRSKEIKHRLSHFRNLLCRLEKSGRSDEVDDDHEEKRLSRRSENILVDGSPGVQAKEVERYLSHQFGMKVLADYTMLRRLKDEIGVQGLAYLVEKVRLQGKNTSPVTPPASRSYADWEEKRVNQALLSIALEYRDRDEHKRMIRIPGLSTSLDNTVQDEDDESPCHTRFASELISTSPSTLSTASHTTGRTNTTDASFGSNLSGRRSSSNSLKRKNSLAKIKKFLKF